MEDSEPIEIPIDGILDLHTFQPREVKDLLPDYLAACRERGILQVRVIHGKGTGTLRRAVHSILERFPEVISFRSAGEDEGGWGATLVELRPGENLSRDKNPLTFFPFGFLNPIFPLGVSGKTERKIN